MSFRLHARFQLFEPILHEDDPSRRWALVATLLSLIVRNPLFDLNLDVRIRPRRNALISHAVEANRRADGHREGLGDAA